MALRAICCLAFVPSATSSPIPGEFAQNITVYHVNPLSEGVLPINMDTADALGDIFFDFRSKVLPIECAENPSQHDCTNKEVVADDLVITKLVLEVDNRFGTYGKCNICVNGTDGHGTNNCTDGEYVCTCGHGHEFAVCPAAVGFENITEFFGGRDCKSTSEEWECWKNNVVKKTGGVWYSTVESGFCGDGSAPAPDGCTWRVVETSKVVNKTCSDEWVYKTIEEYDAQSCFAGCEDSGTGTARNSSSPCWVGCFYKTLLGPDAGKPGGKLAGMPMDDVLAAWEQAFLSDEEDMGGCPAIPVSGSSALELVV